MKEILEWVMVRVAQLAMPERNDPRPKPKHTKKSKGGKEK